MLSDSSLPYRHNNLRRSVRTDPRHDSLWNMVTFLYMISGCVRHTRYVTRTLWNEMRSFFLLHRYKMLLINSSVLTIFAMFAVSMVVY